MDNILKDMMTNIFKMDISEYLVLLASHDVPGSSVIVEDLNNTCAHTITMLCPCDNHSMHDELDQKFIDSTPRSTLNSILSQGYILQSINIKPDCLNVWTFTKPPVCPGCSGGIAEC